MRLAINAIAVIWKLLPRKTNILKKIFLSSALDLLTLAVVAGYFFFSSTAWFMILDVKSRHIRSSPYVPFFHSLCDDCFAEFSSGLLFKSQFHLSYGDLYYKERKTWREQLYFVSLHVYNHVCWLAAVSSEKKTLDANKLQLFSLLTIARCLKFTDRVSSLLRAKRATFTFWVDNTSEKICIMPLARGCYLVMGRRNIFFIFWTDKMNVFQQKCKEIN